MPKQLPLMPSTLSKILHPRRTQHREEFISGSSLGSSLDISNRLSEVLLGASAPLSMKFHKEWRHNDCPVEKWYQKQTEWSTKFTSIEHMRELQAPFHHEYLLIHLDDGAICRLERVGEGARADAIRRMGCIAHDIIQRFPKNEYENNLLSQVASERVILVDFQRTFDLLDVLGICYSMQRVRHSSVYTLQRYNCYFLCMTTLTMLVRRVARWHTVIDRASWSSIIKNTVRYLQAMECNDAYSYLSLGICSLVGPDSSNPRKFILDSIGRALPGKGLPNLNSAIGGILWHKDLGYAAVMGLDRDIGNAVGRALGGRSTGATKMKRLLAGEVPAETKTSMPPNFQRDCLVNYAIESTRLVATSARSAVATYSMREVEDPTPLSRRFLYHFSAAKGIIKYISGIKNENTFFHTFGDLPFVSRVLVATHVFPLFLLGQRLESSDKNDSYDNDEFNEFTNRSVTHAAYEGMYEATQSPLCNTRDRRLAALPNFFDKTVWVDCIKVVVSRQISDVVSQQCRTVGQVMVHMGTSGSSRAIEMTAVEFHDYTIQRIQTHAKRVAACGLAAAKLVQNEMETTMAKVWVWMPDRKYWDQSEPQSSESGGDLAHSDWEGLMEDYGLSGLFLSD
ncbi:unnamed protein product [Rhizoctonia solani]|uniref:Uncharacterized protein n=1 Tax=Rhizoctonia solani TaxID=456999 RepID=A0A8H3GUY7_9AGAM|nr:unnamed protein product [Rhizoctonia solani]